LPTLWVTLQFWFVYMIVALLRGATVGVATTEEKMIRFFATVCGVIGWIYVFSSAFTNYTPLVSLFAVILGTLLPMAYAWVMSLDDSVEDAPEVETQEHR
jgi:hypothetical protein